jgi:hypothetical protein
LWQLLLLFWGFIRKYSKRSDKVAESQVVVEENARHQYCQGFYNEWYRNCPLQRKIKEEFTTKGGNTEVTLHPSLFSVSLELL